jgi:hypothetical protein
MGDRACFKVQDVDTVPGKPSFEKHKVLFINFLISWDTTGNKKEFLP